MTMMRSEGWTTTLRSENEASGLLRLRMGLAQMDGDTFHRKLFGMVYAKSRTQLRPNS